MMDVTTRGTRDGGCEMETIMYAIKRLLAKLPGAKPKVEKK